VLQGYITNGTQTSETIKCYKPYVSENEDKQKSWLNINSTRNKRKLHMILCSTQKDAVVGLKHAVDQGDTTGGPQIASGP
jgi:hypothetical protein